MTALEAVPLAIDNFYKTVAGESLQVDPLLRPGCVASAVVIGLWNQRVVTVFAEFDFRPCTTTPHLTLSQVTVET